MIPYGRQTITEEDEAAVLEALRSELITQGPRVAGFENAIAKKVGADHCVCVNSATSALHIAYLAIDLGPGDLIITSPNTFLATANAALLCGADVDFADIDPDTFNLDAKALAERLELHRRAGRRVKAIVPVHFAGQPCDMAEIAALAQAHGARIIEDAAHAIGARYGDHAVGACTHSDAVIFSFHPVKIITSAEGGAATTNNAEIALAMAKLRSHGQTRAADELIRKDQGAWYYEQHVLGLNYRMTELQAALGASQISRIDALIQRRVAIADRYDAMLADLDVICPVRAPGRASAWHLYVIKLPSGDAARRRRVFERMRAAGIGVQVHYIPVHLQPYYMDRGFKVGDYPVAESTYDRVISLPMFADLTLDEQERVARALRDALN